MKQIHPKWPLCGLLTAIGLFLFFCLPGYKFAGLLLLGLAAMVPAYHFLHQNFLRRILTALLFLAFVMLSVTGGVIARAARGTPGPDANTIIVLGCQVRGTEPSRMLRQRINAAAEYLNAHPDAVAIVSGGEGPGEDMTEAACMARELQELGISPDRILLEARATSTMENLRFSLELTDSDSIAIVSNEFHLYRAGQMAETLGISPALVPADTQYPILTASYFLREILAVWKFHLLGG